MTTTELELCYQGVPTQISDREFQAFRELIYDVAGIHLSPTKRALVCSRLAKRLRELRLASFAEYYDYVMTEGRDSAECQAMINCITTNKTSFFREPHHFDYLRERFLPRLRERVQAGHPRRLRIWSAGCSTGEEPYTLGMALLQFFGPQAISWDIRILASDIDTEVLARAQAGEYASAQLTDVPSELRQRYFQDGAGQVQRVRDDVKRLITFRQINLIANPWPIQVKFDLIFCRNVLIYFDRPTQIQIVSRMADALVDDGTLFLGHSENIDWSTHILEPLGGTIFHKKPSAGRGAAGPAVPAGSSGLTARLQARRTARTATERAVVRTPPAATARAAAALPTRKLIIGDVATAHEPVELGTLLGSCVAVCLFDPDRGVGGMNHFMLPHAPGDSLDPSRYGKSSLEILLQRLVESGAQPARLQAKVFGGARVLADAPRQDIGDQNVRFAREFLSAHGIPIVAERVGGTAPLDVRFLPHTGRAYVRALEASPSAAVVDDELRYLQRLPAGGRR